jgi:hypothetical protein
VRVALGKRRHGSRCDTAGMGLETQQDAVTSATGGVQIVGFEGNPMTLGASSGRAECEVAPPGAVVVPEVVVGIAVGAAGGKGVRRGHSSIVF